MHVCMFFFVKKCTQFLNDHQSFHSDPFDVRFFNKNCLYPKSTFPCVSKHDYYNLNKTWKNHKYMFYCFCVENDEKGKRKESSKMILFSITLPSS